MHKHLLTSSLSILKPKKSEIISHYKNDYIPVIDSNTIIVPKNYKILFKDYQFLRIDKKLSEYINEQDIREVRNNIGAVEEAPINSNAYVRKNKTWVKANELPVASKDILGGIKIGEGLIIDPISGILSTVNNVLSWKNIIDKPETFPPSEHIHSLYLIKLDIINKVDKEPGKSLISDKELERLSTINNYDDTLIKKELDDIDKTKLNSITYNQDKKTFVIKEEGKSLSSNDYTTEEKLKLKNLENYNDLDIKNSIELLNKLKAEKTEIPIKTSQLINDSNFITQHQDISTLVTKKELASKLDVSVYNQDKLNYATKDEIPSLEGYLTEIPSEYITESELNSKKYLTQHLDISGKLDIIVALNTYLPKGNYIETIPEEYVTSSELAQEGFLKEHQSLKGYAKETWVNQKIADAQLSGGEIDLSLYATKEELKDYQLKGDYLTSIPPEYITETELNSKNYLTSHQDISGKLDSLIYNTDKPKFALKTELPKDYLTIKDIENKADKSEIPNIEGLATKSEISDMETKTHASSIYQLKGNYLESIPEGYAKESWVNSQGFLKEHQSLTDYAKKTEIKTSQLINDAGFISSIPSEYITETELNNKKYLTEHLDISGKVDNNDERLTDARPANGGNSNTVNGHTVLSDVPSDAIFTDYKSSEIGHYTPSIKSFDLNAVSENYISGIQLDSKNHVIGINQTVLPKELMSSSVSKKDQTLTVNINGNEQSLTNTDTVTIFDVSGDTYINAVHTGIGFTDQKIEIKGTKVLSDAITQINTNKNEIISIKNSIKGGAHFIGVKTVLPELAINGDICIIGNKEYIWDGSKENSIKPNYKWVELGDTTEELNRITALESKTNDVTTTVGDLINSKLTNLNTVYASKNIENNFTGLDANNSLKLEGKSKNEIITEAHKGYDTILESNKKYAAKSLETNVSTLETKVDVSKVSTAINLAKEETLLSAKNAGDKAYAIKETETKVTVLENYFTQGKANISIVADNANKAYGKTISELKAELNTDTATSLTTTGDDYITAADGGEGFAKTLSINADVSTDISKNITADTKLADAHAVKVYVDNNVLNKIEEAPKNNKAYSRKDGVWVETTSKYTNIAANTWTNDPTYPDFGYKCDITLEGITELDYAEIVFNIAEAVSGNYAPLCNTSSNTVTIYSKINSSIIIPTIIIYK